MKIFKFLIIVILFLSLIRGFTAILMHKDDPTISVALKYNPLSENIIYRYEGEDGYLILWSDENEIRWEYELYFIYQIPKVVYLSAFLILFYFYKKSRE